MMFGTADVYAQLPAREGLTFMIWVWQYKVCVTSPCHVSPLFNSCCHCLISPPVCA